MQRILADRDKKLFENFPKREMKQEIIRKFPSLYFIASGGVANVDDLYQLKEIGCKGAIVGKAIYEGRITLQELAKVNG